VHPTIKPKVMAIIDHHVDEQQYLDANPRIVRPCGSNATLLLEYLESLNDPLVTQRLDQIKSLLVTAIVFDTVELTWRDDPLDHKWAGKIFGIDGTEISELQKHTKPIMDELDSVIIPETNFSFGDLLYKDYKLYTTGDNYNYGISVLRTPFQTFLENQYEGNLEAMSNNVKAFMVKEHIRLFGITLAVREPGSHSFYQQLGIWCFDGSVDIPKFRAHILAAGSKSERVIAEGDNFGLYFEDNPSFSRKKLQPVFQSFLTKDNIKL
jgi:exopolyphosphatase